MDEFDNKPENIFLDLSELKEQNAEAIFKCILETLQKYGFNHTYLSEHLVSFISDGASVMLGCKSEMGARLKKEFPQLVLWHCIKHRLELSVSDAIDSIHGFYHLQSFFEEVYSLCSGCGTCR